MLSFSPFFLLDHEVVKVVIKKHNAGSRHMFILCTYAMYRPPVNHHAPPSQKSKHPPLHARIPIIITNTIRRLAPPSLGTHHPHRLARSPALLLERGDVHLGRTHDDLQLLPLLIPPVLRHGILDNEREEHHAQRGAGFLELLVAARRTAALVHGDRGEGEPVDDVAGGGIEFRFGRGEHRILGPLEAHVDGEVDGEVDDPAEGFAALGRLRGG